MSNQPEPEPKPVPYVNPDTLLVSASLRLLFAVGVLVAGGLTALVLWLVAR